MMTPVSSGHQTAPPVDAPLDPLMEPVVHAMRSAAFRTVASCEGGTHHSEPNPYVAILPDADGCEATRERLVSWLLSAGLDGCYVDVRQPVGAPAMSPFLAVQWWTRKPIERWYAASNARAGTRAVRSV